MKTCIDCNIKPALKGRRICQSCKHKRYVDKDPVRASFYRLRSHAKERGKYFDLTIDQFREFCIKTNYIEYKGIKKDSYHVDRIDETKGYTIDNIQVKTNSDNIKKYLAWIGRDENGNDEFRYIKSFINNVEEIDEDLPF